MEYEWHYGNPEYHGLYIVDSNIGEGCAWWDGSIWTDKTLREVQMNPEVIFEVIKWTHFPKR